MINSYRKVVLKLKSQEHEHFMNYYELFLVSFCVTTYLRGKNFDGQEVLRIRKTSRKTKRSSFYEPSV